MSSDSDIIDDPVPGPSGMQSVLSEQGDAISVNVFYGQPSRRPDDARDTTHDGGDRHTTRGVRLVTGGARPKTTGASAFSYADTSSTSECNTETENNSLITPVEAPLQPSVVHGAGDNNRGVSQYSDQEDVVAGNGGNDGDGGEHGDDGPHGDNDGDRGDDAPRGGNDGDGGDLGDEGPRGDNRAHGDGARDDDNVIERGRGRRRARMPYLWKRQIAKKKRNLGQAYTSAYTEREVAQRRLGNPCRDGCFDRLGEAAVNAIFEAFWALGSFDAQTSYLVGRVKVKAIKRKRTAREVSQRSTNYEYSVHYRGEDIVVCREGFLAMHSISKRKVEYAVKCKKTPTGTTTPDQRGRQQPANIISGPQLDHLHEHIQMLPVTSSHYTRAKSPNRKYLGSEGSIPQLYSKYKQWLSLAHPREKPVSERSYRTIFSGQYNIGFQPPKKDTCSTCGRLETAITRRTEEQEDTTALKEELEVHRTKYKRARKEIQNLKTDRDPYRLCIAIDLQQTLPCPRFTVGQAFYKRKLWVYNFAVTNLKTKKTTLFVWDETSGGRGSSEVASCVSMWLDLTLGQPPVAGVRPTLTIFADNCAGQNKNLQMVLLGLLEVHKRRLARFELCFLVSGHSYMPCDAVFGNIELEIRRRNIINTPAEYRDAIKHAVTRNYDVIHMLRDNFKDYNTLLTMVTKRKVAGVKFAAASQIIASENYMEGYMLKDDFDVPDQVAHKVKLMPSRRAYSPDFFDLSTVNLPVKYQYDRLLTREKITDLQYLTDEFIAQADNRQWWRDLLLRQQDLRNQGALVSSDSEYDADDPDNINMEYDSVPAPNMA